MQSFAVGQLLAASFQFDQSPAQHVNAIGDIDGALGAFLDDQKRNAVLLTKITQDIVNPFDHDRGEAERGFVD